MLLEIRTKEVNSVNRVVGQVFDDLGRQIDLVYVKQTFDCLEDEIDYVRRALLSNVEKVVEYESEIKYMDKGWECINYTLADKS